MRNWLLGIVVVQLACTPAAKRATATSREASDAPSAETPQAVADVGSTTTDATPLEIGWATLPQRSAEAVRLNTQALELHKAENYNGAAAGFATAEAKSPDYDWPRYNAACAMSRLGETAAAREKVEALLLEDLPRFRRRLLDDADLQALRESPDGAALQAELPKISAAYANALQRGAPAMVYTERSGSDGDSTTTKHRAPYTDLRLGVYDHTTKRFVPMVPGVPRTYSGVLNVDKKRAIVAHGRLEMKDMWEVQPHRAEATLFSLEDFGDVVLEAKQVSPPKDVFYGFELWLGPDDALYGTRHGASYADSIDYLRWTGPRPKKIGWTGETGDLSRPTPPAEVPYDDPSVQVIDIAKAFYRRPHGAKVRRSKVSPEGAEAIALLPGHHKQLEVVASSDPMIFAVVSNTVRFTTDGGEEWTATTRLRHVIDLVDLHAGTATRLAKAKDYAHVVWAPDGTLFIDAPSGVSRYASGSTEPEHDVMPGVRFGTPPFPEVGGV